MEYKKGMKVRITLEATVRGISEAGTRLDVTDVKADKFHAFWPEDESVTIEVIRPEVKPGQVWQSSGHSLFVTKDAHDYYFIFSDSGSHGCPGSVFFARYPDARLVFDPDA